MRVWLLLMAIMVSYSAQADTNLIYRLSPDVSHPWRLRFSIKNEGQSIVYILPWQTPLENIAHMQMGNSLDVTCDGKRGNSISAIIKRGSLTAKDYLRIEPGEEVSSSFLLKEGYKIPEHGRCEIKFSKTVKVVVEPQMNWMHPESTKPKGNTVILELD